MSSSNCCFLICIQVSQEAGQVVWYSHLLQNFPQFIVIHTVRGFGIGNKAELDVFGGTLLLFRWSSGFWQFGLWFSQSHRLNLWRIPTPTFKPAENEHYIPCPDSGLSGSINKTTERISTAQIKYTCITESRSGVVAERRYPTSKVRSSSCASLEQLWRDTPRPR